MKSCLESFSVELFYELFEYLSSADLIYSFSGLNRHLTNIIESYPLRLDLRSVRRFQFEFICNHIRPEKVVALKLSQANISNQVQLFQEYFPDFKQQFTHLQTFVFCGIKKIPSNLPTSVSCLIIKEPRYFYDANVTRICDQHASYLRRISIPNIDMIQQVKNPIRGLTHFTTACRLYDDIEQLVERFAASIAYLDISLREVYETIDLVPNFIRLRSSLTHLRLDIDQEYLVSFETFENCLTQLYQLTHFTTEAKVRDVNHIINGLRWEQLLSKTRIIKFDFNFNCEISGSFVLHQQPNSLLDTFRTRFWLEEKKWFVAYEQNTFYTIPTFLRRRIVIGSHQYPPLSTLTDSYQQRILFGNTIDLVIHFSPREALPKYCFEHVNSLRLTGSTLPPRQTISLYVNLYRVRKLDVSNIKNIYMYELSALLNYMPHLYHIALKTISRSLVMPRQIISCELQNYGESFDIKEIYSVISHLKALKIIIHSKELMIGLIDQLQHLEEIEFVLNNVRLTNEFSINWFKQNTRRLNARKFIHSADVGIIYLSMSPLSLE